MHPSVAASSSAADSSTNGAETAKRRRSCGDDESNSQCDGHAAGAQPQSAVDAVLAQSAPMPEGSVAVKGYDFNAGVDYESLLDTYATSGFQATSFGLAVGCIDDMLRQKFDGEIPAGAGGDVHFNYPPQRVRSPCTIFLGYTSNLISSGLRETLRYLAEHNMVDCIVTSAGGVEEDFIKCLAPTYLGDFALKGSELRSKGLNRIGNLIVPNSNYCLFEDWLMPILDQCLVEQNELGVNWTPSALVARLGREIDDRRSVYYWAYRNNIPVFCPSLTDGSLGDMLYFHSYKNPGLRIDIVQDIRHVNDMSVKSHSSGVIILGGGLVKHHILNANLMRNGCDYAVLVNTGQEFDGSDSGARPDEAVSWGKIRAGAKPVKLYADATLVFPLMVAKTFARRVAARRGGTEAGK